MAGDLMGALFGSVGYGQIGYPYNPGDMANVAQPKRIKGCADTRCICHDKRYYSWYRMPQRKLEYVKVRTLSMMTIAKALILVLLVSSCADARPRWYKDWKFWAGEAVIVAATTLDARSTCQGFARGLQEGSFLAHGSRSCGRAVGGLIAADGIYTGLNLLSRRYVAHDDSKLRNVLGYSEIPAAVFALHGRAYFHNENMR